MIITVRIEDLGVEMPKHERPRQVRPEEMHAQSMVFVAPNPWDAIHDGRVVDEATLRKWERGIPKHCSCQVDYQAYKASTPPDFTSAESLWLWGVALHNHVNRKLGKPELTIDEARLQWSRLDDLEHKQG